MDIQIEMLDKKYFLFCSQLCVAENSQPVCYCLDGHQGTLCDICSPFHYGLPPDYPCSDCQCSGNIDTNDPDACNRTTGECINCINNSAGPQCEICKDGFFGDALTQSCQRKLLNGTL